MMPEEIKAKLEEIPNVEAVYKGPSFSEYFGDVEEFEVISKLHPKKPAIVIINKNNINQAIKTIREFYDIQK